MAEVRLTNSVINPASSIALVDGNYIIIYKDMNEGNELKVVNESIDAEFDEPFSLQDSVDKYGEGVYLVIFESWLSGEIWRYSNYDKGVFDLAGKMKGFA